MSLQKKYNRKSLSFLTPQTRKNLSSQARLSLSSNDQTPENLLGNLLNDPLKRALLVEVLSQDVPKASHNEVRDKSWKNVKKFKYESPSALCRRRALAKMQGNSDSSDTSNNNNKLKCIKVAFGQILKHVIVYVEIMSQGKDRSSGVKSLMRAMGADVRDVFSRDLTHVVFKDGSFRTYQKARLLKVHLVSVLWVDAARRHECRMPEKDYPALGSNVSNANVSLICQQFQKDYEDVLQEELNRSKILPDTNSEDIIDTSQNCDAPSLISVKNNAKSKHVPVTPNSMYLGSSPEITSDSDSERCFISNKTPFTKQNDKVNESNVQKIENTDIDKNIEYEQFNVNLSSKLAGTCSQTEELSPLRMSTNSINSTNTHCQPVLNYENVTQRKKNVTKKKVNILEQYIIKSNISTPTEANCNKELKECTKNNNFAQLELNNSIINLSQDLKNKISFKKPMRKLYNVEDIDIPEYDQNNKSENADNVNTMGKSTKYNIKNLNIEQNNRHIGHTQSKSVNNKDYCATPTNLDKKLSSKMKGSATTPRRRSTRLLRYQDNESPQKRIRRNSIDDNVLQCSTNITESDENDVPLIIKESNEKPNLIINSVERGYNDGRLRKDCFGNTASPKIYRSRRKILNFESSSTTSNEKSLSSDTEVVKPILQENNTKHSSEDQKQDNSHGESKNIYFPKPNRRSERILSFRNTPTTSILKSSVTQEIIINNSDISNNDISNKDTLNASKKKRNLQKSDTHSSDEFICNEIRRDDNSINDDKGSTDNFINESNSKESKNNYISNLDNRSRIKSPLKIVKRNDTKNTQNNKESSHSQIRRSTLDFMSKESIRTQNKSKNDTPNGKVKYTQRSVKKISIVCTRFHSTEVQVFQQIVKKLGVFFVEDEVTEKTTHLVAAEPRRTVNLLRAIARGCWILKSEWLYRSLEANQWLPEEDYELCDFSDAIQKSRQERQAFGLKFSMDIFQNCGRIYISRGTNPRCSDLQELVTLCKGTITTTMRNADIVVGEYIDDKPCVTVNWIMDSITFYKRKTLKNYIIDSPTSD